MLRRRPVSLLLMSDVRRYLILTYQQCSGLTLDMLRTMRERLPWWPSWRGRWGPSPRVEERSQLRDTSRSKQLLYPGFPFLQFSQPVVYRLNSREKVSVGGVVTWTGGVGQVWLVQGFRQRLWSDLVSRRYLSSPQWPASRWQLTLIVGGNYSMVS